MSLRNLITLLLGLLFLYGLFTVGFPFLLALVVAIFLEPMNQLLIRMFKLHRIAAATISCTIFTLLFLGIVYAIGLKILTQLVAFFNRAPLYTSELRKMFDDWIEKTQLFYDSLSPDVAIQFDEGLKQGTATLVKLISGLSGKVIDFAQMIPNLFLVYIVFTVALYLFSYSLATMKDRFLTIFAEESRQKVERVLLDLKASIFGFLRAQLILSSLTYVLALIGLMILDVQYAMAVALLIVIVDLLPILGTGSFLMPWAAYEMFKNDIFLAIGLAVLFLVITVVRRIVEPKILGDSVGIGALSALISLYAGFKLFGMIGLFFGPIVIIIYQAMRKVGLIRLNIRFDDSSEGKT
ncbi:sporulation integral membrane protein YtvI [Marinicrinis sediminis]|uniref:Sporulation integral membrane protein YtvI n=1 Tax=Marinicrinis sediminis TaxID=1652465 RepID=A0ABW5R8P6_9BACL